MSNGKKQQGLIDKTTNVIALMEKLSCGHELYKQDVELQEELDVSEKDLGIYLQQISGTYNDIVIKRKVSGKPYTQRAVDVHSIASIKVPKNLAAIFKSFMEQGSKYSWFVKAIIENDKEALKDLDDELRKSLQDEVSKDGDVFLIVTNQFEELGQTPISVIMEKLEVAVKNREYRKISYESDKQIVYNNAKCLKIIFAQNNWYLAIEDEEGRFKMLRVSFIANVEIIKDKNSYQISILEKYRDFFLKIQNPVTRFGVPFKTAKLMVDKSRARFFKEGMKKFFPTQKYILTRESGDIEFSIDYTQPIEILPFIQEWLPHIQILEPKELRDALKADLQKALELMEPAPEV